MTELSHHPKNPSIHFYCHKTRQKSIIFIAHTQKSIFHVFWLLHAMSSPQRPPFPCLSPLGRTCASPCRRLSASSTAVYCTVPSLGEKSAEGISGYPCVALHVPVVFYAPALFCGRGAKLHISFPSRQSAAFFATPLREFGVRHPPCRRGPAARLKGNLRESGASRGRDGPAEIPEAG